MNPEIYRDQVIDSIIHPGMQMVSVYTPLGIQRIDNRFCKRIMSFKKKESFTEHSYNYSFKPPKKEIEQVWTDTYESLHNDIVNNPHLHPTIKENLLFNLNGA
jgi:hypothetical protein